MSVTARLFNSWYRSSPTIEYVACKVKQQSKTKRKKGGSKKEKQFIKSLRVKCKSNTSAIANFAESISRYLVHQHPKLTQISKTDRLKSLQTSCSALKKHGMVPSLSQKNSVVIRDTIRKAVEAEVPIPLLALWGGRKSNPRRE